MESWPPAVSYDVDIDNTHDDDNGGDDDDDDDRMIRVTTGDAAEHDANQRQTRARSSEHYECSSDITDADASDLQRPSKGPLDAATFVVPLKSLVRVSRVFAAMFSGMRFCESLTSEIALRGYSSESVAAFCSYVSTTADGDTKIDDADDNSFLRDLSLNDLQDLLLLSEQYEVRPLKHLIERALVGCITVQNAFDLLVLACDARAVQLKYAVQRYASEHFDDLYALGKWAEFCAVSTQSGNEEVADEMKDTIIDDLSRQIRQHL